MVIYQPTMKEQFGIIYGTMKEGNSKEKSGYYSFCTVDTVGQD